MLETRFHRDASTGQVAVERVQDVEDIIERNKKLQNEPQSFKTGWHHVASIPNVFLERWLNEEYARGNVSLRLYSEEMDKIVERKLRDPEWAWLRTTDKRF